MHKIQVTQEISRRCHHIPMLFNVVMYRITDKREHKLGISKYNIPCYTHGVVLIVDSEDNL